MKTYEEEIHFAMTNQQHIFYKEFHNMRGHLTQILYHMITKCHEESNPLYRFYGAKEIKVCQEWRADFNSFIGWALNNNYIIGTYIHRLNVHKDYSPDNCLICTAERHADLIEDLDRDQTENYFKYTQTELDKAISFLKNLKDK